jgi:ubiquitin conjugation factor E4 B
MAQFEARLKQWTDLLEKSMALKLTVEGVLNDKQMQLKSLLFMRYVTVWLLRVATRTDYHPDKTIE